MKIISVRIEKFRSFKDETIEFNDYNCLVGPNGAGKSTVLNALNVFFRNSSASSVDLLELCEEDFHCKDTSNPIRITVTFGDLSEDATTALKDYVRQDVLVVAAVAAYEGIELQAVYLMESAQLEPYFTKWETKWHTDGGKDINNPKIPYTFVKENGLRVFVATEPPVPVVPAAPELRPKDVEAPEG
ncbi:MAG: putative ATP-dependent endonuclease of the family [Chthoniobacter sp.]|jgi:energy-coupling factor transporter ATP-binding protein EcfA2|nr:putative ATP-dependent endonuclease of the family [Chthoniobacter sp.]